MFTLHRTQTAVLIVDMQEKIFSSVERGPEILYTLCKFLNGCRLLDIPILCSEQYPEGLGETIAPLKQILGNAYRPWIKTHFSCLDNLPFSEFVDSSSYTQWIVVGIEAHICVLQTVKALLNEGKRVVVLNDCIASRSIYDFSTAIAEMRDDGARISCAETVLFELLRDSKDPAFNSISRLIKSCCEC